MKEDYMKLIKNNMNKMGLVSILMPVYNGEKYLRECIDSIISQTYKNIEIVIVDDGSTDSTPDIIRSYNDSRIKYYRKEHSGIAYSLNWGLEKCNGNYIARMDSDDVMCPERIELQHAFMVEHPEYGVISGDFGDLFEGESKPHNEYIARNREITIHDLAAFCIIPHPTVMMRKDLLSVRNPLYPTNSSCEDYALWAELVLNGVRFYGTSIMCINYRHHNEQLSIGVNRIDVREIKRKLRMEIILKKIE